MVCAPLHRARDPEFDSRSDLKFSLKLIIIVILMITVNNNLLDILNNDIGKTEMAPRKPWITETMIKKMEEKKNNKNYKHERV